jgi:hypothetical protein
MALTLSEINIIQIDGTIWSGPEFLSGTPSNATSQKQLYRQV